MLLSRNLGILSIAAILVFGPHNAASAAEPDSVELSNLASCYADGIDMIGNGKSEAGANRWRWTGHVAPSYSRRREGGKCTSARGNIAFCPISSSCFPPIIPTAGICEATIGGSLLDLLDADLYASYVWNPQNKAFERGVAINMDDSYVEKYQNYFQHCHATTRGNGCGKAPIPSARSSPIAT